MELLKTILMIHITNSVHIFYSEDFKLGYEHLINEMLNVMNYKKKDKHGLHGNML